MCSINVCSIEIRHGQSYSVCLGLFSSQNASTNLTSYYHRVSLTFTLSSFLHNSHLFLTSCCQNRHDFLHFFNLILPTIFNCLFLALIPTCLSTCCHFTFYTLTTSKSHGRVTLDSELEDDWGQASLANDSWGYMP